MEKSKTMKTVKTELELAIYCCLENGKISSTDANEMIESCFTAIDKYENIVKCLKKAFKDEGLDFTIENRKTGNITGISCINDLLEYYNE